MQSVCLLEYIIRFWFLTSPGVSLVWPGISKTLLTRSVDLPEAAELGLAFAGAAGFLGAGFFSPPACKSKILPAN